MLWSFSSTVLPHLFELFCIMSALDSLELALYRNSDRFSFFSLDSDSLPIWLDIVSSCAFWLCESSPMVLALASVMPLSVAMTSSLSCLAPVADSVRIPSSFSPLVFVRAAI